MNCKKSIWWNFNVFNVEISISLYFLSYMKRRLKRRFCRQNSFEKVSKMFSAPVSIVIRGMQLLQMHLQPRQEETLFMKTVEHVSCPLQNVVLQIILYRFPQFLKFTPIPTKWSISSASTIENDQNQGQIYTLLRSPHSALLQYFWVKKPVWRAVWIGEVSQGKRGQSFSPHYFPNLNCPLIHCLPI